MTYCSLGRDRVLTEATVEYDWWVLPTEEFVAAGLTVLCSEDDLVVTYQSR